MSPACQLNGSPGRRKTARLTPIDPTLQTTRSATSPSGAAKKRREFDPHAFLATIGEGRKLVLFQKKQTIFSQGDPTDAVFYIQTGKVKLTVVSKTGKEATIGMLGERDFFGEGSLAGQALRMVALLDPAFESGRGADAGEALLVVEHLNPFAVLDRAHAVVNRGDLVAERRLGRRNVGDFEHPVSAATAGGEQQNGSQPGCQYAAEEI